MEVAAGERDQLLGAFRRHPDLEALLLGGPLAEHLAMIADTRVLVVFIESRVDAEALERMPRLQLLATRSTGVDHIDLEACRARGVAVSNVPTYGENTVAEHTFALLLALSRRLLAAVQVGRHGRMDRGGLQGFDLKDRTLGVVGTGRIGLHVIRIARAFGMRVLAYDLRPAPILAEVLDFEYASLEDLLARSDVVSLHVPATAETRHLIDAERLARMRPGAVLINTARGDLVDTRALLDALDFGHLAGAGLDVVEHEQDVREDRALLAKGGVEDIRAAFGRRLLADRDDVLITPHNAFNSYEAVQRIADTTVEAVAAWASGREIPNRLV